MRFAPVVCALDLAPESEPALVAAVDLSARAGGPLHLLTVRAPDGPDVYRAPSDPEAGVRAVVEVFVDRALGAGACARLAPEIGVVRGTDPVAEVTRYAEAVGAGTVVLGTHGRRGVQRFRLGSTAEGVVRRSAPPVLVVPNQGTRRSPGPDRPVLVAVDFSEGSARALVAARALANLYGAPVDAVFVEDGLSRAALVAGTWAARSAGVSPSGPPSAADLEAFARDRGAGPVRAHVVQGVAADEVVRRADEGGAGAVVMGTHGRSGLGHALFGSVTAAVLRRLRSPLLAVGPPSPPAP